MLTLDSRDYKNLTDYLQHLYQCQPFERGGIQHPVIVHYPGREQIRDPDSILDPYPPKPEKRDFAAYDYAYLHDLQNSKPNLYNGATFTLKSLRTKPLKLRANIGRYFDMLATCAALEHELRAALAQGWMLAPSRKRYHRQIAPSDALTRGDRRSAAIGIGTLTVFNDAGSYKALLSRRSRHTGLDSGLYHVLPAMMFDPGNSDIAQAGEWSVRRQVLREVAEELFNAPEAMDARARESIHAHPALVYLQALMEADRARLYLTGILINLLTLRPEISTLLLIHDPAWYARVTAAGSDMPLATSAETQTGSMAATPIDSDEAFLARFPDPLHLHMPAHALATLWLGIDLARAEITRHHRV